MARNCGWSYPRHHLADKARRPPGTTLRPGNRCRRRPCSAATFDDPTGLWSLYLDPQILDYRPPFLGIGFHERAERFRRLLFARENFHSGFGEPRLHCRIGQGLHRRRIELADHVPWRAAGREKPEPIGEGKCRQAQLANGRDVRCKRQPRVAGHCVGFYAPDLHQR
jgi:hypothetical protein